MNISKTVNLKVGMSEQQKWCFIDGDAVMSRMARPCAMLCKLECQHVESNGRMFFSIDLNMIRTCKPC